MSDRGWTIIVCPKCDAVIPLHPVTCPNLDAREQPFETLEVMPVSEHEEILRAFEAEADEELAGAEAL